jgi:hypothetical protein
VSAVSAAFVSVIVYVVLGLFRGLWLRNKVQPAPFNTWLGFTVLLGIFLVLGWQSHQTVSLILLIEVLAGSLIGVAVAWIGIKLKLPSFRDNVPLRRIGIRVVILLFPALLLWPRGSLKEPALLAYAFGLAGLFLVLSRLTLDYFIED